MAPEYTAYNPTTGMATAVDLLGVRNNRWIVIEFKCGYEGYEDYAMGMMQTPFENVPSCVQNHHHLQVAWGAHTLTNSHKLAIAETVVIRIRKKQVCGEAFPHWLVGKGHLLDQHFMRILSKKRKKVKRKPRSKPSKRKS